MAKFHRIIRIFVASASLIMATTATMHGQNYIKTETYLNAEGTEKMTDVQYYDDLGRPALSAFNGVGTNGKYVYKLQTYDTNGRVSLEFLPVVGSTTVGVQSDSCIQTTGSTFYGDSYIYTQNYYDALHRPTTINGPGQDWRTANRGKVMRYDTNEGNSVKRYTVSQQNSIMWNGGYYPAGSLTMEETVDEDQKKIQVYKNLLGQVVLERNIASETSVLDTYYIYNTHGQLAYALNPQYQISGYKEHYGYEYRYDEYGRVEKRVFPHCEIEQNYYDTDGRVIYKQDALGNFWFFFYDTIGRLVIKGTCSNFNYHHYQNVMMDATQDGLFGSGYVGTSSQTLTHGTPQEIVFYDDYQYLSKTKFASSPYCSALTKANHADASGLQTGSILLTSSGSYILKTIYYDQKGRVIDCRETIEGGGIKTTTTAYSHTGKPVSEVYTVNKNGVTNVIVKTYTYYNTNDQIQTMSIAYNGGTPVTIANYAYNDLGQIETLTRGGNAGSVNYEYNLRGWTTYINGKGFKEWLHYTDGTGSPCYSGNISSMLWKVDNENFKRGYSFNYDGFGRMGRARYAEGDNLENHIDRYSEEVKEYFPNGGIRKIERYGKKSDGKYGKIDNLRYYYNGMQLDNVKEDALPLTYTGAFDFVSKKVNTTGVQYAYYDDGSLKWDANKGISKIDYDLNGYPRRIQFSNGNVTEYSYSSTGEKLSTIYRTAVPNITVALGQTLNLNSSNTLSVDSVRYVGKYIFKNGLLNMYLVEGGYATMVNGQPVYHYYTKDHQGNNRAVVNHSGTIEQIKHYYPFGAIFSDAGTNDGLQKYKYNGKELDRMYGLNEYDYGARQYDPLLCQFTQMDPLAEKYYGVNPYAYCANNPVRNVDPNGMEIYMLFYTFGNNRGDEMFRAAAETRKYDIEHSDYFDPTNDIVLLIPIQDLAGISQLVGNVIDTYSENFGKTAEFGIWSHASIDGPKGTVPTSTNAIDEKQMSIEGWGNIVFNWGDKASASFYGCRAGVSENGSTSFTTQISGLDNFRNVSVYGQTAYSYPSRYTNVRKTSLEMMHNNFSYPTYMVGGKKGNGTKSLLFGIGAYPMRKSRNGYGVVSNYYQPGKTY
jgi:RHS repeat-associated protein